MTQPVFETTATALREKSKLQRHFRRFDVFFYLICTVVTIDTIGAVASNGAQGFTWLIFLGVLFFLPYALFAAIEEFFGPVGGAGKYVYAVAFIWFTIVTAIVSLRYGKWVPTLGA
jgi:glutamate:GABA antiporter